MSYTKNKWAIFDENIAEELQPDAAITKDKLEHMEDGIEAAHKLVEELGIGEVVEGESASAEFVEGKLNLVIPRGEKGETGEKGEPGNDGAKGDKGDPGLTPVKGEDYFTDEDKDEIANKVLALQKNEPYYDEDLKKFFACGVHINVYKAEEEGKLRITWLTTGKGDGHELIIPENTDIFGGCASSDLTAYFPATSIAVYSGNIDSILGGCYGNGNVANTTVIVNGGKINYVSGAGMHWNDKLAYHNNVGHADIIINDAEEIKYVAGGTISGVCTTGSTKIVVNGGNMGVVMAGGTNGYTGIGEIEVNGGTIRSVQAGNRGTLGNIKITVNDGTITNAVYGGVGDTGTYIKSEINLNGGKINNIAAGKYAGVDDTTAERISGTYVDGVISDSLAKTLHLTKVYSHKQLLQRIIDVEISIANA